MEEVKYDSSVDTLLHIKRVNELLTKACKILIDRGNHHDSSKLKEPEKSAFDKLTPLLLGVTYGSPEYNDFLEQLKPALDHHYATNTHHPQHYNDGINGMNLFDLIEMFFDWKAASERQSNGNICTSIKTNGERFQMSDQLTSVFINTTKYLGW